MHIGTISGGCGHDWICKHMEEMPQAGLGWKQDKVELICIGGQG